jgi:UDP-N-acetyl-2-amino-2-deoxyglucuronate dehydrogenase
MRVGIIGTGAVSHKHAQALRNIGYELVVCTDLNADSGRSFAAHYGCEFAASFQEVCQHPRVDYVDVCTFPNFRLDPVRLCADAKKHIQVQKPIATNLETAQEMIRLADEAGIHLGVISQHRFDQSTMFVRRELDAGRLGKVLQADAYVKWYRTDAYYSRPIKGSWATEGGGALVTQAIHQMDLLLWLIGPLAEVFGYWQLGARHKIESEDVLSALLKFESGATGVVQASTAFWPGYPERIEIQGTRGTAILTGDKLTTWDVEDKSEHTAPLDFSIASGAADPAAISVAPFERQFLDFGEAIRTGRKPVCSGPDGYRALQATLAVYQSCREGKPVRL